MTQKQKKKKNENHFLRKLTSKSDFENRLNILKGYSCFWVVRGNKIIKSHVGLKEFTITFL